MKAYFKIPLAFILIFALCILLCSCARVVTNTADEFTMHTWQTELENGNVISLSFARDYATLTLSYDGVDEVELSGLCELSDTAFVIHDKASLSSYIFDYTLHYDCVDITYADTTVSLNKIS